LLKHRLVRGPASARSTEPTNGEREKGTSMCCLEDDHLRMYVSHASGSSAFMHLLGTTDLPTTPFRSSTTCAASSSSQPTSRRYSAVVPSVGIPSLKRTCGKQSTRRNVPPYLYYVCPLCLTQRRLHDLRRRSLIACHIRFTYRDRH
jgi:hypothetical protein